MNRDFSVNAVFLMIYLVAEYPGVTGLFIHEWIGVVLFILFLVHAILHGDWMLDIMRRLGALPAVSYGNLAIDIVLFVVFLVVTLSGLMVSRHVLPAVGFYAPGYFIWKPIHAIFAEILLVLIILHLVTHWRWVWQAVRSKQ